MSNDFLDHPPPEMRSGCETFRDGWEESIEKVFIDRTSDEGIKNKLCVEISQVSFCLGD